MTWRAGGIAGIVACVAALAWYLGSPLFIRTTANEAFPSPAAAGRPRRRSARARARPPCP